MPNANYHNPPVDAALYFSDAQTVTSTGASTNYFDFKAANCFPSQAVLVLQLSGIGSGESIAVKVQSDDNSSFSTPTDVLTIGTYTSTPSGDILIPLSNLQITERYVRLYYTVSSGDSIPVTAFLSLAG